MTVEASSSGGWNTRDRWSQSVHRSTGRDSGGGHHHRRNGSRRVAAIPPTTTLRRWGWGWPRRVWMVVVVVVVVVQRVPTPTHAFANYLLSRSNCWTELSTDEVIMNHPVVAASASDDPFMLIQLAATVDANGQNVHHYHWLDPEARTTIAVSSFPVRIPLQVLTTAPQHNPDYQWVMDVVGSSDGSGGSSSSISSSSSSSSSGGSFVEQGACDGHTRVAGRSTDVVTVTLTRAATKVTAAWATSHEAVRLTPAVTFVLAAAAVSPVDAAQVEHPASDLKTIGNEGGHLETGPSDGRGRDIPETKEGAAGKLVLDVAQPLPHDPPTLLDDGGGRDPETPLLDPHRVVDRSVEERVVTANDEKVGSGTKLTGEPQNRHPLDRRPKLLQPRRQPLETPSHGVPEPIRREHQRSTLPRPDRNDHVAATRNSWWWYEIGFHRFGLSVSSYFQGATWLILASALAVYLFLWFSQRAAAGKGRRAL